MEKITWTELLDTPGMVTCRHPTLSPNLVIPNKPMSFASLLYIMGQNLTGEQCRRILKEGEWWVCRT